MRIQRHDKLQADLGASCEYDGDMQRNLGSSKDKDCPVRVPFGATMESKAQKLCRVFTVFAIALMASDFLFASELSDWQMRYHWPLPRWQRP